MGRTTDTTFADLIDLAPAGGETTAFNGPPAPERGGRVYGGQFLAQAVAAAYRTVSDERRLNSIHGYFERQGDVDQPTRWEVEPIRDGRSFANRSVFGSQNGREVFRMLASFHTPEDGFEYQPLPDGQAPPVPPPDEVELSYVEYSHRQLGGEIDSWFGRDRPMEIRYANPPPLDDDRPVVEPQLTWTRLTGAIADDPVTVDAGLAYLSDATLVDHVVLPAGRRWHDDRLTGASLDHAMWFHRSSRPDGWHLFDQRVEWTGAARGLATGRLYDEAGALVATCAQEGLIRWESYPPAGGR